MKNKRHNPPAGRRAAFAVAAALTTLLPSVRAATREPRPNIIVLLADDLGYADLGITGCKDIPTPAIDSIARAGVTFPNGYVTCPVCAPSRAGLLTGRYQQRFGFETNPGYDAINKPDTGLPLTEKTVARRLKDAGYRTAAFGKWHLGSFENLDPLAHGFDYYFGFRGGMRDYFPKDEVKTGGDPHFGGVPYLYDQIFRNREPIREPEYLTKAIAREATGFMERSAGSPYFMYVAFNAVHNPLQAPAEYRQRFSGIPSVRRQIYAGMVAALDDAVGRILRKLEELHQTENTIIFFLSDNGGGGNHTWAHSSNTGRNVPLRGYKFDVYEGGIRVPFLLQWKGRLPAGRVYAPSVSALDICPTALTAAGVPVPAAPEIDGVDLVPFVLGRAGGGPHADLYWRWTFRGGESAMRRGDWKIVMLKDTPTQLYNLGEDIGEQHDLAPEYPERVKEMVDAWKAWSSQMAAPRW